MKTLLIALAAAVLGLAVGVGSTMAEFWNANEWFHTRAADRLVDKTPPSGARGKVVVLNGDRYEFGVIERNTKDSHEFQIKNEGKGSLAIKVGHTTCKCTVAQLDKTNLKPGETTTVKLEWEVKSYVESFQQSAELETSDPDNPIVRLTIVGRVAQSVRPVPEELDLPAISANEDHVERIKIYGFIADKPLEITKHSFENPDNVQHWEMALSPLAADDLKAMPDAKSGVLLTVTTKSGLPIGALNQTIRLETNLVKDPIEIPVRGSVASDISLVHARGAKGFNPDKNLLQLGKLKRQDGAKVQMFMLVKGPHSAQTQVQVASVDPAEALQVTLGEPTSLRDGAVKKYPLTITIPADAPLISRQGGEQGSYGKVVFSTTHPIAKEVRLFVQFAIEE